MPALPSEFEEKEFEAPLYNQLECGTRLVWSPGQVFEQYVGFDRAMFLYDVAFWRIAGRPPLPGGVFLQRFNWPFWRERPRRALPTFRLNLFIQAKRNYYHRRLPRVLRGKMERRTCWRFDIDASQQEALSSVAQKVGSRAIVCYAAPAFHRIMELNAHTVRGTIVQHSTFPLALMLRGHSAFYYCAPGGSGIANPEPEHIKVEALEDILRRVRAEIRPVSSDETVSTQLQSLAADIELTISEDVADTNPRKALFFEGLRENDRLADEFENIGESGRAFLRVATFASVFNLDWYAVHANE